MSDEIKNIDYDSIPSPGRKKRGKLTKFLMWSLFFLLLVSIGGGVLLFRDSDTAKAGLKNANGQISELQKQVYNLRTELDTTIVNLQRQKTINERLQHENDTLKTLFPIHISKIEVANADANGNTITSYGKPIQASSSMYLMPRITYWGLKVGGKITLNVRLYDSDGKLVTGTSSPAGYSFSCKIDPIMPNENMMSLSGWGGADKGHFKPGSYRYEVWYENVCLQQLVFSLK